MYKIFDKIIVFIHYVNNIVHFSFSMDMIEIGAIVKGRRTSLGLTQGDLASRSGLSRTTISTLENGQLVELGVNRLMRLLEALGLDLSINVAVNYRPTMDDLMSMNEQQATARNRHRYRG